VRYKIRKVWDNSAELVSPIDVVTLNMKFSFAMTALFTMIAAVSALPVPDGNLVEVRSFVDNEGYDSLQRRDPPKPNSLDDSLAGAWASMQSLEKTMVQHGNVPMTVTGYKMDGSKSRKMALEDMMKKEIKKQPQAFEGVTQCTITATKKEKAGKFSQITGSDYSAGYSCTGKKPVVKQCAFYCK